MTTTTTAEQADVEAFVGTVLTDCAAWMATTLAMIGDRLGLWQQLAAGPATSAAFAERAGIDERYGREWLAALTAHGYLHHNAATGEFTLPAAHRPALADEGGPFFFGGAHQEMLGTLTVIEPLIDAFRQGGGVPATAYGPDFWTGLTRFTNGWFTNLLLQEWIPALPGVEAALERGCDVADVGSGRGHALVKLAQAFPASRYVGFDVLAESVEAARAHAADAGVADRVRFECVDASRGLPGEFDVITTFDVVHDTADPRGLLRAIRAALRPTGHYVCLDVNASDRLADNQGPIGTFLYGFSVLYCMTVSLAEHGEGLGTCGFNEHTARTLCAEAGFTGFRKVPLENPFNNLYEILP